VHCALDRPRPGTWIVHFSRFPESTTQWAGDFRDRLGEIPQGGHRPGAGIALDKREREMRIEPDNRGPN